MLHIFWLSLPALIIFCLLRGFHIQSCFFYMDGCLKAPLKVILSTVLIFPPEMQKQMTSQGAQLKIYLFAIKSIQSSIHFLPLIWVLVAGAAAMQKCPDFPSWPPPPALPGGHCGVPKPSERHYVSNMSWVCPWVFSQLA